jgi:hypothetical protein
VRCPRNSGRAQAGKELSEVSPEFIQAGKELSEVSPEFIGKWLIKKGFDLKKRMHYLFGNETA